MHLQIYGPKIFDRSVKEIQWGMTISLTTGTGTIGYPFKKIKELWCLSLIMYKNQFNIGH